MFGLNHPVNAKSIVVNLSVLTILFHSNQNIVNNDANVNNANNLVDTSTLGFTTKYTKRTL